MEYFDNVSYMISHLFLMTFLYLFIQHRYSKVKTMFICFSSFLILNLFDILKLNIFPDSDLCYVVVTIVQILVTQLTGIFIARERDSKVLFMGLSSSNYVIAGSIIAAVLNICTKNTVISLASSIAVHLAILLFLHARLRDVWLKCCEREYGNSWLELCLIPVFFYCGFSFISFFPQTLYDNPNNIPGILLFVITMFVSYVAVFRYVESEVRKSEIYWENVLFESYIKGLENQSYLVEQSEQNLRIMRHDLRHYASMMETLLDQGEYAELRKIMKHICAVADENSVKKYCNNLIVNTILSNMAGRAEACGIELRLEIALPRELPVNSYEFAAVLANLLENAQECVRDFEKEKRYIEGEIRCTEEYLLLHIRNEYRQEIVFSDVTGLPKSNKGKNHGLGMQSILAFSDKLGGNVGCYCEKNIFHIMLFAKF